MGNGKPYLGEIIETGSLKRGQANIIVAPCHSGKTTAAFTKIASLAEEKERVLYLIDTTVGREALLEKVETARYTDKWRAEIESRSKWELTDEYWGEYLSTPGVRVMTYHLFGIVQEVHPEFVNSVQVLICDEMHNLIKYLNIERANNQKAKKIFGNNCGQLVTCETALEAIVEKAKDKQSHPLVVVITATANEVSKKLHQLKCEIEHFDYTDRVHQDLTYQRKYYSQLEQVIDSLQDDERALIYISRIEMLQKYAQYADDGWRNICVIWSAANMKYKMDENQLRVRDIIITTRRIPKEIDLLFINAAYETSINIENEDFNTVIVHCGDPDIQTQVRGRIRHDIQTLYLYDSKHENVLQSFPAEYYGRFLTHEDRDNICKTMNLKNENSRLLKWPSVVKLLRQDEITANMIKEHGNRGWILYPAS